MKYDVDRYQSLRASAVVRYDFYMGSDQDLSASQRATTVTGSEWTAVNGWPWLSQRANADGTQTANVARCVDVTGAFYVEALFCPTVASLAEPCALFSQYGATGGFRLLWDPTNTVYTLVLLDNAGATARSISTPATSAVRGVVTHLLISSSTGGTAGTARINGIPVTATLGGAGAAANIGADSPIRCGRTGAGLVDRGIVRVWSGTPSSDDATALYSAAQTLVRC